ncbi:DNA-processing protein DprA [Rhodocyclus gracilis]|uniref:DNA-protecting protein DprA n=1 Tax=Rhodocyclus tenuis TaxID=1066 RepID=A0A6L5JY68_RHOTE|nr:DNA-processing protein DprA [Rhodocyclus gracilis]MQY51782.1 DNA-protecting protein DprA [Rhodocyclus gracilis]
MTETDTLAAWLRLTLANGVGSVTQRRLLTAFGPAPEIFDNERSAIAAVIGSRASEKLFDPELDRRIDATLEWHAKDKDRHLVVLGDDDYPTSLLDIADPPTLLYVRGERSALTHAALAIVGSRNATPAGISNAESFAGALARAGLSIVSGLALGIDGAAHRGALSAGGHTVALIGTGIDRIYPARHHQLALDIAAHGAVVSEYPLGTPPLAANFPRRNRLIAGMSRGVLVVEAAVESGSLITARLAAEQGRDVFAIPGSIHSPQARGCHRLLREGAKLIETAEDVLEELRWSGLPSINRSAAPDTTDSTAGQTCADSETPDKAQRLLAALGHDPCALDELALRSGLTAGPLSLILLQLELDGRVASLPGGRYQRLPETP